MSTITTINGSDNISTSDTVINTNFSNLNTDKIETSVLDTDTSLAANSDSKIATQKAVKAYVDAGGNVNASETSKGIVEEATDAEVTAGTATGGTGAKLFVTPAKLATRLTALGLSDTSATFLDDFNRSDIELNGNNGWTVRAQGTGVATNGLQEVDNNRAEAIGATAAFSVRALAATGHQNITFPWSFNCNMGMQSTSRAYSHGVVLGSTESVPATLTAFRNGGITVFLQRSDANDTTSDLSVYDGPNLVAQDTDLNFDYGTDVSFTLTISTDGSGSVVIYPSSDFTGTPDTLSWSARCWAYGIGNNAGFILPGVGNDGLGQSIQGFIDNFDFDYYITK